MKWFKDMSNCKYLCAVTETETIGSTDISYDSALKVMAEKKREKS
jgi:hypothetical protein